MKLKKVRIRNFQSIQDSNEFEIGDVTCLVGKNESGKTALLKALYRLNPLEHHVSFNRLDDYPRHYMPDYLDSIEELDMMERDLEHPTVVHATYELDQSEIDAIAAVYGPGCLKGTPPTITLHKGYENNIAVGKLGLSEEKAIKHLVASADLSQPLQDKLKCQSVNEMVETLRMHDERTSSMAELAESLAGISEAGLDELIYEIIGCKSRTD